MEYQNFTITQKGKLALVAFNRPEKANSLHLNAWEELKELFETLDETKDVRVIVLSGEGKHFCAGIDLELLGSIQSFQQIKDEARKREKLRKFILKLQAAVSSIERCSKPVLAAIHQGCIGAGVDIASACDMRYCTEDAYFTIKEIDMGMVADLGTLQRLPKILPAGLVSEMAFTGKKVGGLEALNMGLVNQIFPDKPTMLAEVEEIADTVASKSPISIRGTKEILRYSRDHSIEDSLNYIATWNAAMILSEDLTEAFKANQEKRVPKFED